MMQSFRSTSILELQKEFEADELSKLIDELQAEYLNCEILIKINGKRKAYQRVMVMQEGKLAFCGAQRVNLDSFVNLIHPKIDSDWFNRIFESSQGNLNESMTPRQLCERLLQARIISKSDLLKILLSAYILSFEPLLASSGELTVTSLAESNSYIGIDWRIFRAALEKRQQIWDRYPALTDGMNSVPILTKSGIEAVQSKVQRGAEEEKLVQQIETLVDGRSSIIDLAHRLNVDPLSVVKNLAQGFENNWLITSQTDDSGILEQRSNVLVIDQDPITRKLLLTILQEFYNTFATEGALGAFGQIHSQNIDLVIVSHSIPTVNGLQLCKIIRQNQRYQRMPIIFISSKENFLDRLKAKMSGVTDYITHPFDSAQIIHTLDCNLH